MILHYRHFPQKENLKPSADVRFSHESATIAGPLTKPPKKTPNSDATSSSNHIQKTNHIFITHGFLGSSANWVGFCKAMQQHSNVWAIDLRSHGKSPHSSIFNFTVMAEDVLQTIEQISKQATLDNILLLGHSMGGKVAVKAADMQPNLFGKLVIADISIRSYPSLPFADKLEAFYHLDLSKFASKLELENHAMEKVNDIMLTRFLLKSISHDHLSKKLVWNIPFPFLYENKHHLKEDVIPIEKIKIPTLFLRGERSNYIEQADQALISKHFEKSQIITIANAGHWLHADNPVAFFDCVKHFAIDQ